MKKLLIFSIISALICATVFAEVTVTTGAGMSFIPIGAVIKPDDNNPNTEDGAELVTGFGKNGDDFAELQVDVKGTTENGKAGFLLQWRPKLQGGGALEAGRLGDNAGLWFKPLDVIQIDAGKFANTEIRRQVGNGAWFGDYTLPRADENNIFTYFGGNFGVMASLKPIEPLSIYALLNNIVVSEGSASYNNWNTLTWGASQGTKWIWQNTQVAVGYALPNIGLARVQFVGGYEPSKNLEIDLRKLLEDSDYTPTLKKNAPRIEAAFAFKGVPNLILDVGGKVWVPVTEPEGDPGLWPVTKNDEGTPVENTIKDYSYWKGIGVGLGINYAADPLTVNFIISATLAGNSTYDPPEGTKIEIKDALALKPYVAVAYKLNDTFTAQLEGGLNFTGEEETTYGTTTLTKESTVYYGFGTGLQTTLAPSCTIKIGLTYAGGQVLLTGNDVTEDNLYGQATDAIGVFSVPIIFSVSF